jgi:hypothetical protein
MPRTATPTVTDLSVDTLRKYALSNKSFVAAINKRRKALTAQIEEIDGILSGEGVAPAPKKRGRPAKSKKITSSTKAKGKKKSAAPKKKRVAAARRGRPAKGKTSLKAAVLEIIRSNGGRVDVADIMGHLKKMGFDTSAKSIGVMIQHALRSLANTGMIDRSERGVVTITAAGSAAAAVTETVASESTDAETPDVEEVA